MDDDGDLDLYVINDKPKHGFRSGVLENKGDRQLQHMSEDWMLLFTAWLAWRPRLDGYIDFGITGWSELPLFHDGYDL